ncbi:MAG TPA: GNAT family N-acetyltransferase [Myxococcota bacterium]|nr:GNAT family N-acetyltransferase [Myxococcota bacterium]HRY93586.1 GNAT family N-acetyltransferase [Myxococcota bacterium]
MVLQLPSEAAAAVTPTRLESLRKLAAIMRLVPPESLLSAAERSGLMAGAPREVPLPQDKRFHVQRLGSPVGDAVIRLAWTEADYRGARGLFEEYARHLGFDLCFQGFATELESLSTVFGPPHGCLLLLELAGEILGCVGVRRLESEVGELKRMYLRPAVRGRGFGRRLGEEALRAARALGYRRVRLDTLARMTPAAGLYRAMGFKEIPGYRENPLADAVFFEIP